MKPKIRQPRAGSINSLTIDLLKAGPKTLKELHEALTKLFPDHDPEVLLGTTIRRLHGDIERRYGVEIRKDNSGVYYIK